MLVTLLGIVTEVKPEQPLKAATPMLVTLLGIVTEVKPEQLQKACNPMLVTLLGIVMDVKAEQFCPVFPGAEQSMLEHFGIAREQILAI